MNVKIENDPGLQALASAGLLDKGCGDSVYPGHWSCSYHTTWHGQVLHVGASTDCIVAVRLDGTDDVYIDLVSKYGRTKRWNDVALELAEDVRFSPAPTDDEIEEAVAAALALVRSLSDG